MSTEERPSQHKEEFFIDLCVRGAQELRKRLKISEPSFQHVHISAHTRGRDVFVYGTLDLIERVGVFLMQQLDFFSDNDGQEDQTDDGRRLTRNVLHSNLIPQELWRRNLTEALVLAINFGRQATNAEPYYCHYLNLSQLNSVKSSQADLHTYYGIKSREIESQINDLKETILGWQSRINLSHCWYLELNRTKDSMSSKPRRFKDLLNEALIRADIQERQILGLSYFGGFGEASENIHFGVGRFQPQLDFNTVQTGTNQIGLLALYLLLRCCRLLRIRPTDGYLAIVQNWMKTNAIAKGLYDRSVRPSFAKGDIVLAQGLPAIIEQVVTSRFGYKGFQVRYLRDLPTHGSDSDWFPGRWLQRIWKRDQYLDRFMALLDAQGQPRPSKAVARECMLRSFLYQWDSGRIRALLTRSSNLEDTAEIPEFEKPDSTESETINDSKV